MWKETIRFHTVIMRKTTMVICRAHKMQLYTYAISAIFEIKKWIFIGIERYKSIRRLIALKQLIKNYYDTVPLKLRHVAVKDVTWQKARG